MNNGKKKVGATLAWGLFGIVCLAGMVVTAFGESSKEIVPVRQLSQEEFRKAKNEDLDDRISDSFHEFTIDVTVAVFEDGRKNQCYSPLSMYYSLGVLAYGAEGKTRDELFDLLQVSDKEMLAAQYDALYRMNYMRPVQRREGEEAYGPESDIGSSLWLDDSISYKNAYVNRIASDFYTETYQMNLAGPNAKDRMSGWIAEKSRGSFTLRDLGEVPDSGLVLLNTVYYAAYWADPFNSKNNTEEIFYAADGKEIKCEFMHQEESADMTSIVYYEDEYMMVSRALTRYSVFFILPEEGKTPAELLSDPEIVRKVLYPDKGKVIKATWHIPKFTTQTSIDCKEVMGKIGVNHLIGGSPNLRGITDDPVYIESMTQTTRIGMDEKGVVVASVGGVSVLGAAQYEWIDVNLNRPFIYIIYGPAGVVAIGTCDDPTAQ